MVRHSTLSGTDLHPPMGLAPTPLNLADNTANAYQIRHESTLRDWFNLTTTTGSLTATIGNASGFDSIHLSLLGLGNFGIGVAGISADSRLHVMVSDSTSGAPVTGTVATFERNGVSYVTIYGPAANDVGLILGNPTTNDGARFWYNQTSGVLGLRRQTVDRVIIDATGVAVGGSAASAHMHLYRADTTATELRIENTTTGDSFIRLINGSDSWSLGIDDSDSATFKVSEAATLGSNTTDRLRIHTTNGAMHFSAHTHGNAAIDESARTKTARVQTTEAGLENLWTFTVPDRGMVFVKATIIASNATSSATYIVHGAARRFSGGATTEIDAENSVSAVEDAAIAGVWAVAVNVSSNDIRVQVNQAAGGGTTTWVAVIEYQVAYI